MSRGRKLFIIAALQMFLLAALICTKYYTLHFGAPVLLKASPLDPWDIFRGEYVRLEYEISKVRGTVDSDLDPFAVENDKTTAYVTLEPEGGYWKATGIYKNRPETKEGRVIIRASSVYYNRHQNEYLLTYGIESYYVEEGEGKKLERLERLDVLARVDRFGNAAIEKVTTMD